MLNRAAALASQLKYQFRVRRSTSVPPFRGGILGRRHGVRCLQRQPKS